MEKSSSKHILFLYTELAAYIVDCINHLAEKNDVKVKIVRWPLNEEAPFKFQFNKNVEVFVRNNLEKPDFVKSLKSFNPNIVFISGWVDKKYRQLAKEFKAQKIPVLLGLDNPWKGNFRQHLAVWSSSFYLKPFYSHVWCPGKWQYEFATRIGFQREKILTGFYCGNIDLFKSNNNTLRNLPKTILYAGRFLDWKGVRELYQGFKELKEESPNDWNLLMYGRGPLKEELTETESIKINDFIQPEELREIMQNVGAFCLPSYEEHWGVAVHEAAAAGCQMLVSDGVGAGTAFVRNGYNGYVFESKNKTALKQSLKKLMSISDDERKEMNQNSVKMAEQITPDLWSATLLSVLN